MKPSTPPYLVYSVYFKLAAFDEDCSAESGTKETKHFESFENFLPTRMFH